MLDKVICKEANEMRRRFRLFPILIYYFCRCQICHLPQEGGAAAIQISMTANSKKFHFMQKMDHIQLGD